MLRSLLGQLLGNEPEKKGEPRPIKPTMPPSERPARQLDAVPPDQRRPLAACALLIEMARIDNEFDDDERAHILDTLRRHFSLSTTDARELMEMAEEARDESSDIWKFTNLLNEQCSHEEKLAFIEDVWRVVYADGEMHHHEDFLAHQMGRLLNLPHHEIIDAKLRARGS
mgnify:CR=1 FL=1